MSFLAFLSLFVILTNYPFAVDFANRMQTMAAISELRVPAEFEIELSKYKYAGDDFYKKFLEGAWFHGRRARQKALNLPLDQIFGDFENQALTEYKTAEEHFSAALEYSLALFKSMRRLIAADLAKLDLIGAENYSGPAGVLFYETQKVIFSNNTNCDGALKSLAGCVSQKIDLLKRDKGPRFAASVYNSIAAPDKSFFTEYFALHKNITIAINTMFSEHQELIRVFDQNVSEIKTKIRELDAEDLDLIDVEIKEAADILAAAQETGAPRDYFKKIKTRFAVLELEKARAKEVFELEEDNYLHTAIERLKKALQGLAILDNELDGLRNNVVYLRKHLEDKYMSIFNEVKADAALLDVLHQAMDLREKADSAKSLGRAIEYYDEAIEKLNLVEEFRSAGALDISDKINYLSALLDSAKSAGIDVDFEAAKFLRIKKVNEPELIPEIYKEADVLISKIKFKMDPLVDSIEEKQEEALSYLETAKIFLADPVLAPYFDELKLDEYEREFLIEKDPYLHAAQMQKTFSQIIDYYSRKFEMLGKKILSNKIKTEFFFQSPPTCAASQARVLFEVTNPLTIDFENVALSYEFDFPVDGNEIVDNSFSFLIDKITAGRTKIFETDIEFTPIICQPPLIESIYVDETNAIWVFSQNITPLVKIKLAQLRAEISNVLAVEGADFNGTHFLFQNLASPTTVTAKYRTTSPLNVTKYMSLETVSDTRQRMNVVIKVVNPSNSLNKIYIHTLLSENATANHDFETIGGEAIFSIERMRAGETKIINAHYFIENRSSEVENIITALRALTDETILLDGNFTSSQLYAECTEIFESQNQNFILSKGKTLFDSLRFFLDELKMRAVLRDMQMKIEENAAQIAQRNATEEYTQALAAVQGNNRFAAVCKLLPCRDLNDLETEAAVFLSKFNYDFTEPEELLAAFKIAIAKPDDIESDPIFSYNDYTDAKKTLDDLRAIANYDFQSSNPISNVEEMMGAFQLRDLINFEGGIEDLKEYLNSSLSYLHRDAKLKLLSAKNAFENATNKGEIFSYLEQAKESFDDGRLFSASAYATLTISGASTNEEKSFPYEYLAVLAFIAVFVVILLRKPKTARIKRALLRI